MGNVARALLLTVIGVAVTACGSKDEADVHEDVGRDSVADGRTVDQHASSLCGCSLCQAACVTSEVLATEECPVPPAWHHEWCSQAHCVSEDGKCMLFGQAPDVAVPDIVATPDEQDSAGEEGQLGMPCQSHEECFEGVGLCYEFVSGFGQCTAPCVIFGDCPGGYQCHALEGPLDPYYNCVPIALPNLCMPCTDDQDCYVLKCVDDGIAGRVCALGCAQQHHCSAGFECREVETVDGVAHFCLPEEGASCTCSEPAIATAAQGTCLVENEHGACPGTRSCLPDGTISECSGQVPAAEVCDGLDNDCDQEVDEGFDGPCG